MTSFQAILNRPATDIERPKPYPVGTYVFLVEGLPKFDKVGQNQTDRAEFDVRFLAAQSDVNQEDLAAMGGIQGKSMKLRFFITEDAAWRFKKFLVEDLGIDEAGKSLGQLINEAPGKQFLGTIRHQPSRDGTAIYSEISQTARL